LKWLVLNEDFEKQKIVTRQLQNQQVNKVIQKDPNVLCSELQTSRKESKMDPMQFKSNFFGIMAKISTIPTCMANHKNKKESTKQENQKRCSK